MQSIKDRTVQRYRSHRFDPSRPIPRRREADAPQTPRQRTVEELAAQYRFLNLQFSKCSPKAVSLPLRRSNTARRLPGFHSQVQACGHNPMSVRRVDEAPKPGSHSLPDAASEESDRQANIRDCQTTSGLNPTKVLRSRAPKPRHV